MPEDNIGQAPSEQNIDDILALLKNSCGDTDGGETFEPEAEKEDISNELLQRELKNKFKIPDGAADESDEDDYALDSDFLREINSLHEEKDVDQAVPSIAEIPDEQPVRALEEELEEDVAPWDELEFDSILVIGDNVESKEDIIDRGTDGEKIGDSDGDDIVLVESSFDAASYTEDIGDEETESIDEPEMTPIILDGISVEDTGEEETESIDEPVMTPIDMDEIAVADAPAEPEEAPSLDNSALELLLQLDDEEMLREAIGDEKVESLCAERELEEIEEGKAFVYSGEEYVSGEQNSEILSRYAKALQKSLIAISVSAFLSLLIFVYDLLPIVKAEIPLTVDYIKYPVAYLLIGLQLLLFACVMPFKKLIGGLKNIFLAAPDAYSFAALTVLAVSVYDISLFFHDVISVPVAFHFVTALMILCAQISEHLALCREKRSFSVYSEGGTAFTLTTDVSQNSVARKLYKGGVDALKNVKQPKRIEFPSRFFRAAYEKRLIDNPIIAYSFIPIFVLSLLAGIVCMIVELEIAASVSAVWVALIFALPTSLILCDEALLYIASKRLAKRKCAMPSRTAISRCANTDIMVFEDIHLFEECDPKKLRVIFYDKAHSLQILSALDGLYSNIGGPLKNAFSNIPEAYKSKQVRILRCLKNGIEAIIDKKHLLIVGDAAFMDRYGYVFPESKNRSTLCVSLDGSISARIGITYSVQPVFEMLAERLAQNGVYCAVETYDPMINSALVKSARTLGNTPISIVHRTAKDIYAKENTMYKNDTTEVLVRDSRLKLAETVIWAKRIVKVRKIITALCLSGSVTAFAFAVIFNSLGLAHFANQYVLTLLSAVFAVSATVCGVSLMPSKYYFSYAKFYKDTRNKNK